MTLDVAPDLAGIVSPGVVHLSDALVIEHDARLGPVLAATEAALRIDPPEETAAVRTMYRHVIGAIVVSQFCR